MSKAKARRFFMLMAGKGEVAFALSGKFPAAYIGVPYDETLNLIGVYDPPAVIDAVEGVGAVPAGLTLEIDATGTKARLHGTAIPAMTISGTLPRATIGQAYSERLQVANAVGAVVGDIATGAMPAWMSITWHSDTQELEFHGMPA